MNIILSILVFIISIIVLARSSVLLVSTLGKVAGFLGLNNFSVAFLLMALATSLPEIFVGISAALDNVPSLVLGNVVGSNIVNLSIVFGIVVIISGGVQAQGVIAKRDSLYMMMFSSAPILLLVDNELSRGDGFILLIFYFIYILRLLDQRKSFHEAVERVSKREAAKNGVVFMVGMLLLLISADLLVQTSLNISQYLGLSIGVVGLFIVSIGTSLPELAFSIETARKHEDSLLLGDLIGSVVTNSTFVLGLTALVKPIKIENISIYIIPIIFLLVVLIFFELMVRRNKQLGPIHGIVFIFVFIAFMIGELLFGVA